MSNNPISNQSVLSFDGIDDNLTLPKGFPTIDKAITIEFWAKGENNLSQTTNVFNACNAQGNRLANVHLPWGGQIYWDAGDENGSFDRINKAVQLEEYNAWTHWAFLKDVATGKMWIYRNGEIWHQGEGQKKSLSGITKFFIGCFSNYSYYWKGSLTEFRIWNIVRTPEEIKQNMNSRLMGNEPGLVGYYPLNGDVNDKTTNANHATINGAVWQQAELPIQETIPGEIMSNIIAGGNTPTKYGIADSRTNFYLVDTNNPVNGNGELTGWEIWAENTLPVQLVLYRKEADLWSFVGKSEIKTPVIGLNQFSLSAPIKVKKGDFVGIYYPQAGSVSFQNGSYMTNLTGKTLFTATGATPTAFVDSGNRIYSLSVKGNVEVSTPLTLPTNSQIKLKSWKGDYLHRPDSAQDVTTWDTGIGNEWIVESIGDNKIKLKSWKGDYLHRPDSAQGVTTWSTGIGNEWVVESIGDNKIKLKSWKGDYLHRPDSAQGVTTWSTGIGNEWMVEVTSSTTLPTLPLTLKNLQSVLTFDGQDDYISVSDSPDFQISAYTVEVWIKPNGEPNEAWKGIVGKPGRNFNIWLNKAGFIHHRFHDTSNTNAGAPDTPNGSLKWDQWNHLAITNDGKTAKTYINGNLEAQGATGGALIADKTTLYICRGLDGGNNCYFKGQIADIRIWNQVHSQDEIKDSMNQRLKGNESGLVAYWPLNEGSGNTAKDQTANGNNGVINGAIWTEQELPLTKVESAIIASTSSVLQFDGKDDYVEIPFSQSLNPKVFTVSAWVKVVEGQGTWRSVITSRDDNPLRGYIVYAGDNNKWQAWVGGGKGAWEIVTGSEVIVNTWTHVTSTFDGSQLKLYINGTEVESKAVAYLPNSQRPLRIGTGATERTPEYFYGGYIAEVCVWDKVLTQTEIQQNMHKPKTGNEPGLVAYYPLNEGSGNTVGDKTGKGNKGTINGAIWKQEELPVPSVKPSELLVMPENQQTPEPVKPSEPLTMPQKQQTPEPFKPTKPLTMPQKQQLIEPMLKLRKGFSFDEAILMTTIANYAFEFFEYDDGSVDDSELKTAYKAIYKNQGWDLVHTIRNDNTNSRGLILKNTQSGVAHQYAISLRGTSFGYKDTVVSLDNIISDFDWKLINYGALSVQRAKVVQGVQLAFESVADEIEYFFKTLRGEVKPSDFRRLRQLPPLRKFACLTALADAGAIRLGTEFDQQAQDLVAKVVADGEIDDDEELEQILQFLEEQLLSKLSPLTEPIEVWVTGFSLGAATCQLAALALRRWFGSAETGGLLIKVYAIASPKIANQEFIDFYNQQIGPELAYRVENAFDIVPTYPYDPPFLISAIAPEGLKIGNVYIGKYANGGEPISIVGLGDGQSGSISIPGLLSIPYSVPMPHSPEVYKKLLEDQKQFWNQLARPFKDISRPFLVELLHEDEERSVNANSDNSDEDITIIK